MSLCFLVLAAYLGTDLPQSPSPTYNQDLAPVINTHCTACHHDGGVGPFPLTTYAEVRKHAAQIADVTARRYMPPWPPDPGLNSFKGDRHLTPAQIKLFADWSRGGRLEGPGLAPAAPTYSEEWQLGPPDLILRIPAPFHMPASGPDLFRNFVIPSGLSQTRYIRGFELRLNNKRAVHHANVVLDRTQSMRSRDGEDGQPGFPGMDVTTEAAPNDFDPDSHFLFWKPATVIQPEPPGRSWRLDPGTDLILNLHLQPTGKPETLTAEIGLYFSPTPPTEHPMLLQLEHDGVIHIPPGSTTFTVEDHLKLPVDVDLLAIYPHAHYLGKIIEAWATFPDGHRQALIHIPDWDINWQATYEYSQPIRLPRGTVVAMRIRYDNSAANIRNPNHPPVLVKTGNRSQDEMGHVWLQVLPKEDARWPLQEASMLRRLEKYPHDFLAHYNLGAFQQSQGKLDAAAASYRAALQIEGDNPTARNSLATVEMQQDQLPEAIADLRQTLLQHPDYLNARYNLAQCLSAAGDLPGSAAEYSAFLAARPDDAAAQKAAASVYLAQRNYPQALTHLQTAARLDPANADLQANLGALLAMTGDLPAAIAAFESALKLDPNQPQARQNLTRAKAQLAARSQ